MKRLLLSIALTFLFCISAFSQATSLTIDCQTPGWLSSMINYGDQQTLQNIKVTGYINDADLTFLGSLSKNQQLNGIINLEDVQIVADNNSDNNKLTKGYFSGHIHHLILPKTLVAATKCLAGITLLDSLTIGGEALPIITNEMFYGAIYSGGDGVRFNEFVKHLILREGVTTISGHSFYNSQYNNHGTPEEDCIFESIDIPSTVNYIGGFAFYYCFALSKATIPDNVDTIGEFAFCKTKIYGDNDSIYLPKKLKNFHFNSFAKYGGSNYASGSYINQHIFVPKSVECLYLSSSYSLAKCYLHMESEIPPKLSGISSGNGLYKNLVLYVPKNSVSTYKNSPYWSSATILAEPNPAQGINIEQEYLEILKGNSIQLSAVVYPDNADDKNYTWSSSNVNIVTVSQNGIVTAQTSGEAKVYAILNVDHSIADSCRIKVYQPVTEIRLDKHELSLKVGELGKINVQITPYDADNKTVTWASSNEEVATVDATGKVTALKAGEVWIKATSNDNIEAKDSCALTVIQPVTGITLSKTNCILRSIGETVQLEATVLPEDASNKDVRWNSSNQAICVVSNGTVVATGFGIAVVFVTTVDGGFLASATIKVIPPGDVNCDGKVNAADVTAIYNYILNGDKTYEDASDVNGDNTINAADVTFVYNIILGLQN